MLKRQNPGFSIKNKFICYKLQCSINPCVNQHCVNQHCENAGYGNCPSFLPYDCNQYYQNFNTGLPPIPPPSLNMDNCEVIDMFNYDKYNPQSLPQCWTYDYSCNNTGCGNDGSFENTSNQVQLINPNHSLALQSPQYNMYNLLQYIVNKNIEK